MSAALSRNLLRAVAWYASEQHRRLVELDPLADLGPYRRTLEQLSKVANPTPKILAVAGLIEAEIPHARWCRRGRDGCSATGSEKGLDVNDSK